jgi:hypothetical protein
MGSLHKLIFDKATYMQEGDTVIESIDTRITFHEGRAQVWSRSKCVDINQDGFITVRGGDVCTIALVDLYIAVQLLQLHYKKSMPRTTPISSLVPAGLHDFFWRGECTEEDLAGLEAEVFHRKEEAEPGVFLSLNMFGTTLSFMDAYNELLTEDNLAWDDTFPVCVIKTPTGFMVSEDIFQFDDCWGCQAFMRKLQYLMLEACRDRLPGEKYTYKHGPAQVSIHGSNMGASSYVLYTTMSDVRLDMTDNTFDVVWRVM